MLSLHQSKSLTIWGRLATVALLNCLKPKCNLLQRPIDCYQRLMTSMTCVEKAVAFQMRLEEKGPFVKHSSLDDGAGQRLNFFNHSKTCSFSALWSAIRQELGSYPLFRTYKPEE